MKLKSYIFSMKTKNTSFVFLNLISLSCGQQSFSDQEPWIVSNYDASPALEETDANYSELDLSHEMFDESPHIWNEINFSDDLSPAPQGPSPSNYRVAWRKEIGSSERASCLIGHNGISLWKDAFFIRYLDPEIGHQVIESIDPDSGELQISFEGRETLSAPILFTEAGWFGVSKSGAPYHINRNISEISHPFEKSNELNSYLRVFAATSHGDLVYPREGWYLNEHDERTYQQEFIYERFMGLSKKVSSSLTYFKALEGGGWLDISSTGSLQYYDRSGRGLWSRQPTSGQDFIYNGVKVNEDIVSVEQATDTISEQKKGNILWDSLDEAEPPCQLRVLDANRGFTKKSYPVWGSLQEKKNERGRVVYEGINCGSFTNFVSDTTLVRGGTSAVWMFWPSAWWPGINKRFKSVQVERFDLMSDIKHESFTKHKISRYLGGVGQVRGTPTGLLGIFTGFDEDKINKSDSLQRYSRLVHIKKGGEIREIHVFDNLEGSITNQGYYFSLSPCLTPPLVDSKDRIFVALHEKTYMSDGNPWRGNFAPRSSRTFIYSLEPIQ